MTSIVLAAACTGSSGLERHADREGGPLSASSGDGVNSLFAPGDIPWYGSFGSFVLCTRTPGQEITLGEVTYDAEVEPLEVTPYLRTVSADEVERQDNGQVTVGLYSAVGKPPNLHRGNRVPGTFTTEIAGHEITDSCDEQPGFKDGTGDTELIMVMENDERGGYLPGVSISYTAGDREYILDTNWGMISCGSAIPTVDGEDVCAPAESSAPS